jgi:hypothetical protein
LFSLISLIFGGVSKLLSSFLGYKTAETNDQATIEAARIEGFSTVESKWWFVAILMDMFALPYAIYVWKAVAWDKVIAPHLSWCHHACSTTDPINGYLMTVFGIVVTGLFMYGVIK